MSPVKTVLFNLEPYSPNVELTDEVNKKEYVSYLQLISSLSPDGAVRFQNAMLSTARYIYECCNRTNSNYKSDIDKIFVKDGKRKLNIKSKSYFLRLVERVIIGNVDTDYIPTNHWEIDSDLSKAILIRSLLKVNMTVIERDIINEYYGLEEYSSKIYCGFIDDSDYVKYANDYNRYLYQFYSRSNEPDAERLKGYECKSEYGNMIAIYDMCSSNTSLPYCINLNIANSINQTNHDIAEFSEDLKFIAKRLYEVNHSEDRYKSTTGGGNSHYSIQFALWKRYLRVYDLYKDYTDTGKTVRTPQIDAIGIKIVNEFKVYTSSDKREVRKEILRDYKEALRLIEQSVEGYLS